MTTKTKKTLQKKLVQTIKARTIDAGGTWKNREMKARETDELEYWQQVASLADIDVSTLSSQYVDLNPIIIDDEDSARPLTIVEALQNTITYLENWYDGGTTQLTAVWNNLGITPTSSDDGTHYELDFSSYSEYLSGATNVTDALGALNDVLVNVTDLVGEALPDEPAYELGTNLCDAVGILDSALSDVASLVGSGDFSSATLEEVEGASNIIGAILGLDYVVASIMGVIGDTSDMSSPALAQDGTIIGAIKQLDIWVGENQADISTLHEFTGYTDWETNITSSHYGSTDGSLFSWVQNIDDTLYGADANFAIGVETQAEPNQGYAATYNITQGGTTIGTINIPKDFLVKSATLETCATANTPVQGYVVGDKYIDFVINAVDASETAQHIYLKVSDLVDVYTAQQNAAQVQVAVSGQNVISASIVAGSIGTTELSSGVNASLALADSAIQGATDTAQIDMTVTNKNISATIIAGSVTATELASNAVTTIKIADSNVTTAKIADNNVTTAKIADSNVTTAKIADSNVTTAKIADSNVTTAKLADDAVTAAKIADRAVGTAAIGIEDEDTGDIYTVSIKSGRLIIRMVQQAGS